MLHQTLVEMAGVIERVVENIPGSLRCPALSRGLRSLDDIPAQRLIGATAPVPRSTLGERRGCSALCVTHHAQTLGGTLREQKGGKGSYLGVPLRHILPCNKYTPLPPALSNLDVP